MQTNPPDIPDLGGKSPDAWNELITRIGEVDVDSRKRSELEARLQTWILITDVRIRQMESAAAERHASALHRATWVLAVATIGLFIATVVLALRTP